MGSKIPSGKYADGFIAGQNRDSHQHDIGVDSEIGKTVVDKSRERNLQMGTDWLLEDDTTGTLSNLDLNESKTKHKIGQWDQFQANDSKFGVQVGFDENKYTTANPIHTLNPEEKRLVEQKAKEIERGLNSINGTIENTKFTNKGRDNIKGGKIMNKNDLDKGEEYEAEEEDSDEDEEAKYSMVKRITTTTVGRITSNDKDKDSGLAQIKQERKDKPNNKKEESKILGGPPGLNTITSTNLGTNSTPKRFNSYREACKTTTIVPDEGNLIGGKNGMQNDMNGEGNVTIGGQQRNKNNNKKDKNNIDVDGDHNKRLEKDHQKSNDEKGFGK